MRVPSSLAIYVAAAELTNYKKHNPLRHPRRKPHINHSLLSLLKGELKEKRKIQQVGDFDFNLIPFTVC